MEKGLNLLSYFLNYVIAHTQRLYGRWLEQGARAAVVVQDMQDAYAARSLEAWISANYRIPERITSGQKQQHLHMPYHFGEASMALSYYLNLISEEIDSLTANHPIQDLQTYYFTKGAIKNKVYELICKLK